MFSALKNPNPDGSYNKFLLWPRLVSRQTSDGVVYGYACFTRVRMYVKRFQGVNIVSYQIGG